MATAHKKLTATAPVATVFKGTEHEAKTLILQQSQQSKQQHLIQPHLQNNTHSNFIELFFL